MNLFKAVETWLSTYLYTTNATLLLIIVLSMIVGAFIGRLL